MARTRNTKSKSQDTVGDFHDESFLHVDAVDNVDENYLVYSATAVIRKIPDVRDGLIPVYRRIIYCMSKDAKLTSSSKHMKNAKVSGFVMGNYHPHGDNSIEDSMANLAKEWNYRIPLVDIMGNRGTPLKPNNHAAARYLECRLTSYAEMLLSGVKQNAVDMVPNYDKTTEEPTVLPAEIPLLFVNGTAGKPSPAVGWSTDIPPHNVNELLAAAELLNRKPDTTLEKLMEVVQGPDLPTGNILLGLEGLKDVYGKGEGKFIIRVRTEIEDNSIIITEIPFGTLRQPLIESIVKALGSNGLESQVISVSDESFSNDEGTEDTRIVIRCEKNADVQNILNFLYKKTDMQKNYNCRIYALVDGTPKLLGLKEYLELFLDFRRETIRRIYTFDLEKKKSRLHIVDGFITMIDIAEDVIKTIRSSNGRQDSAKNISRLYGFSEAQADAIVSMQLYRISHQDLQALSNEKSQLESEISHLEVILNDTDEFRKEISRVLKETKKKTKHLVRKSVIDDTLPVDVEVKTTNLITEQKVVVAVSPYGVQRMSSQVYENNKDKVESAPISVLDTTTTHAVALFTRNGLVMQRQVHELENLSIRQQPDDLRKQVKTFNHDDEIIHATVLSMDDVEDTGMYVVSVSALGQVKKNKLEGCFLSFSNKGYLTRSKPYNGLKLDGDHIVWIKVLPENEADRLVLSLKRNTGGRTVNVAIKDVSCQGNSGSGTNYVKVPQGSFVEVVSEKFV